MSLILNKSQAEAVFSAMCALNNVGMRIDAFGGTDMTHIRETPDGRIVIHKTIEHIDSTRSERHASQAAFATAYGLTTRTATDRRMGTDFNYSRL